jgi:hypothetical protein
MKNIFYVMTILLISTASSWAEESGSWTDKIKFSGDLRYRAEFIENNKDSQDRHRIRARLGITATPLETLDLVFRLATGNTTDPVSNNQTLENFTKKAFILDLAYFDWHPEAVNGLHVIGGKTKNPFYTPASNQLIWDGDLTPEGIAIQYKLAATDALCVFLNGAGFWADERADADDSWLLGGQGGIKFTFMDGKTHILLGTGYYHYTKTRGNTPFIAATNSNGNTVDGSGNYAEQFGSLEALAEFGIKISNYRLITFGEFVRNVIADNDRNAWIAGLQASRTFGEKELSLFYNYRWVKADAVLGLYNDSDFSNGSTNSKGHKMGLGFKFNKYVALAGTYFNNKTALSGGNSYQRVQLDANLKF